MNMFNKAIPRDILRGEPQKHRIFSDNELLSKIQRSIDIDLLLKTIGTAFACRTITVNTTPTEIIRPNKQPRGYIILNPTQSIGLTATGTLYSGTFAVDTNTNPLGVANYKNLQLFMDITDSTGTVLTINAQAQDPVSSNWVTTQSDIFSSNEAVGTYFADLGSLGISTQFRLNMIPTGSYTLTIGYVLKDGIIGNSAGISQKIYIGNQDVTITNGYDVLEGTKETFFLKENVSLWAIAESPVTIKVFELQ